VDATSLTYSTYRRLRADVLTGRLPHGKKLKIQELSEYMGVGPGVVREALSRLTSESLVVAMPQRGFRVAPITAEDVRDLTEARIEIELVCLRRSITKGDVTWEAGIVAALHQLNRTPSDAADLSEPWTDAHAQFHDSLVRACDSKWLLRVREQLFIQGERYRRINLRMSDANRDLRDEHREIAEAAIRREVERTCDLMEKHIRLTETLTLRSLAVE
jgi:DNA-binding GntR family transcriptional regulator